MLGERCMSGCMLFRGRRQGVSGFTLAEVVVTIGILALVAHGLIYGYILSAQRAEWSAHSLAAQSLASQSLEQARAAKWDPQAWPVVDELPPTNYVQVETLDVPLAKAASPLFATNYVRITAVSTNPLLREIRSSCVWAFSPRGRSFTNTQITLRAPDQ